MDGTDEKILDLLKRLNILGMIQAVALGIALGLDELLEIVAPVADGRCVLAQHFRHFAHCVNHFSHNLTKIAKKTGIIPV